MTRDRREWDRQQILTLARLAARIPKGCPIAVERRASADAWREYCGFRAYALPPASGEMAGRAQVVAAFIDGFVAAWEAVTPIARDYAAGDRALVLELANALEAVLKSHGYISDPECRPVDCECPACLAARAVLERLPG